MKAVSGLILVVLILALPCAVAQEGNTASDYKEVIVERSNDLSYDFNAGQFRYITGAVLTLIAEDPKENLPIRAGRVEFTYPDAVSNVFSRIVMTGNVEIDHPQGKVTSQRADFDFDKGLVEFTGDPVMYNERAPEGFFGSVITLDLNSETLNVKDARSPRVIIAQADVADRFLLTEADIKDWAAFITELKRQYAADSPTPGKHIVSLLDPQVQTAVTTNPVDAIVRQKGQIVKLLNGLLKNPKFYSAAAWQAAPLDPAAVELLAKGPADLAKEQLVWANRAAFRAAFPELIATPPALAQ